VKSILVLASLLAPASLLAIGCTVEQHQRSNSLEYLYPKGAPAMPPQDVQIRVPARVGIAFAPAGSSTSSSSSAGGYGNPWAPGIQHQSDPFSEVQKQVLLGRIAEKFKDRQGIAPIEIIPSSQLSPGGGFEQLDRIRQGFGVDLVMLISYDQFQFSESAKSSWTYLTIVGAYVVKGEKSETRTVMDAVVYDVATRTMLFHASGVDSSKGSSTPVEFSANLRQESEAGFTRAVDDLMGSLDKALAGFQEQAANGTVHGPGTPALAMVDEKGGVVAARGPSAAGASGVFEIGAALLLLGILVPGAWRRA
jgi:rhombotail lipoprotein